MQTQAPTQIEACVKHQVTQSMLPRPTLGISAHLDKRPNAAIMLHAPLTPHTRLAVGGLIEEYKHAVWDARMGAPYLHSVWRFDVRDSFIAHDRGEWHLRLGAARSAVAQPRAQSVDLMPSMTERRRAVRAPFGISLVRHITLPTRGVAVFGVVWGVGHKDVAPNRWAWQGDGWQTPHMCRTSRDCVDKSVCAAHGRCVALHGVDEHQMQKKAFALALGMQQHKTQAFMRYPLARVELGASLYAESRRLTQLRQAQPVFLLARHAIAKKQMAWRSVLEARWGKASQIRRGEQDDAQEAFDAEQQNAALPMAERTAIASPNTHVSTRHGLMRAVWSRDTTQTMGLVAQQHNNAYDVRMAVFASPSPQKSRGVDSGTWPKHWRADVWTHAALTPRLRLVCAPQLRCAAREGTQAHVTLGLDILARKRGDGALRLRLWRLPLGDVGTKDVKAELHLLRGIHLTRRASCVARLDARLRGGVVETLGGAVHLQFAPRASTVRLAGQWSAAEGKQGPRLSVRLGGRWRRGRIIADADVALAFGPTSIGRDARVDVSVASAL